MGTILLEDMEFYAYHGCFDEEQVIGNRFLVTLELQFDTLESELTDELKKTVNYQDIYRIVCEQMQIKSKLLENVALRISDAVLQQYEIITYLKVKVSKLNPPVGGKIGAFSVVLERDKD